jgi:hypothetical protein
MQLLKSLEQIRKEVKEETKEIPEWRKEFERIQSVVWEKGKNLRREWVLNHKIKHKTKKNKKLWLFKRMADEYSTYIY